MLSEITAHKITAHKITAHKITAHKITAHKITAHKTRGSFFETTINFKQYVRLILVPFLDQLTEKENSYGPYMQGNATLHKQLMVLWVCQPVFGEQRMSYGMLPAC